MNARIPMATVFLAAAALLLGGSATAQRHSGAKSYRHQPNQERYGGGMRGSFGRRGHSATIRAYPAPRRLWVPGQYEWVTRQVWVPAWTERVWVDPAYDWRLDFFGSRFRVLVRAGYWRDVFHPGHYEARRVRIWQPGYWSNGYGGYR